MIRTAMSSSTTSNKTPLYLTAAEAIRSNIQSGTLECGLVLLEGPIAELLNVSRNSVKRALLLLEQEGIVTRFNGRGYLVGQESANIEPVRKNLKKLNFIVEETRDDASRSQWKQIYSQLESDISSCLVFGQFRIIESDLADHFKVSRTIIRDALGRLQERGLVSKTSTSRWIVKPLTAQSLKDKFELSMILEVAALRTADKLVDSGELEDLCKAITAVEQQGELINPQTWLGLVEQFVDLAILSTPNRDLRQLVANNRKTLQASQQALFNLGLTGDALSIREIRMVCELLIVGATPSAAELLEAHIAKLRDRTIAQLKIVAVLPKPAHLAHYLVAN